VEVTGPVPLSKPLGTLPVEELTKIETPTPPPSQPTPVQYVPVPIIPSTTPAGQTAPPGTPPPNTPAPNGGGQPPQQQ
jgi:hypothetical protein